MNFEKKRYIGEVKFFKQEEGWGLIICNELKERTKGKDIFVETHFSANSIVKLCEDVLSLFGYKDRPFVVGKS